MEHPSYTRLMKIFQKLGISTVDADLARRLNTSDQTVNNWKRRGVSKDALIDLSDEFGFRIKYVLYDDGDMFASTYKTDSLEQQMILAMQELDESTKYKAVRMVNMLAEPTDN